MRIPVLAVLGRQEPLVESASASFAARPSAIPVDAAEAPFPIDPRFPAVPLGLKKAGGPSASLTAMHPDNSEQFVVRAHVEVDDLNNIPTEQDGVPIFADPKIAPFLTCGGSPPLGNAATVATKLNKAALAARGLDGTGVALAILDTGINLPHLTAKLGAAPRFDAANSWNLPGSPSLPGSYPVDHGTMCAFDALIMAPKATLLDIPVLAGSAPGASRSIARSGSASRSSARTGASTSSASAR